MTSFTARNPVIENSAERLKREQARARRESLEDELALQLRALDLRRGMSRELRFHGERQWRFDFAWPAELLAVEVEGGLWIGGRHNRPKGMTEDMDKYNAAALLGWRVLRVTESHIKSGQAVQLISKALEGATT